jgi:hypothetical protein
MQTARLGNAPEVAQLSGLNGGIDDPGRGGIDNDEQNFHVSARLQTGYLESNTPRLT